ERLPRVGTVGDDRHVGKHDVLHIRRVVMIDVRVDRSVGALFGREQPRSRPARDRNDKPTNHAQRGERTRPLHSTTIPPTPAHSRHTSGSSPAPSGTAPARELRFSKRDDTPSPTLASPIW